MPCTLRCVHVLLAAAALWVAAWLAAVVCVVCAMRSEHADIADHVQTVLAMLACAVSPTFVALLAACCCGQSVEHAWHRARTAKVSLRAGRLASTDDVCVGGCTLVPRTCCTPALVLGLTNTPAALNAAHNVQMCRRYSETHAGDTPVDFVGASAGSLHQPVSMRLMKVNRKKGRNVHQSLFQVCHGEESVVDEENLIELITVKRDSATITNVLIVSDAGCGKTVLLHRIAWLWAAGGGQSARRLRRAFGAALLVRLADVPGDEHDLCHYLHRVNSDGPVGADGAWDDECGTLLLLDAYDEMCSALGDSVRTLVDRCVGRQPSVLVISSQQHAAASVMADGTNHAKWSHMLCLDGLRNDEHTIVRFVEGTLRRFQRSESKRESTGELAKSIYSLLKRAGLCTNPLFVTLACELVADAGCEPAALSVYSIVRQFVALRLNALPETDVPPAFLDELALYAMGMANRDSDNTVVSPETLQLAARAGLMVKQYKLCTDDMWRTHYTFFHSIIGKYIASRHIATAKWHLDWWGDNMDEPLTQYFTAMHILHMDEEKLSHLKGDDALMHKWLLLGAHCGHMDIVSRVAALRPDLADRAYGPATGLFDGSTPLICAARSGHTDVVQALVAMPGADVNAQLQSQWGRGATALMSAAGNGHCAVVDALLAVPGVQADAATGHGSTALMWAAENGHCQVVRRLLAAANVEVNARDRDGWTALMWAACQGHDSVIRVLLGVANIDVHVVDREGDTARQLAASNGHGLCAAWLAGATRPQGGHARL